MQIHAAFGKERRGVEIIGIALIDLAHGIVIGGLEAFIVGTGLIGVPLGERFNVIALVAPSVCGKRQSLLYAFVSQFFPLVIHGQVVVRSKHQRYAPIRHGHFGVELSGTAEALFGLTVVEAIIERHGLLEQALRLRVWGVYRVVYFAETWRSADGRDNRGGGMIVLLRRRGEGGRRSSQQQ